MKKILSIILVAVILGGVATTGACFGASYDYCSKIPDNLKEANGCSLGNDYQDVVGGAVSGPINAVLFVVGILAVILIIYGGFTYITSAGDSAKVNKAKTILIYSIVGLVIAILAYVIVNFVVLKIKG